MPSPSALGTRDILGVLYEELDKVSQASWTGKLSQDVQSDQETETYKLLNHVPGMREWVGGRQLNSLGLLSYALTNKVYEDTLVLAVDDLRRDKTGQCRQAIADLAVRANTHWEDLLTALIAAGETGVCADTLYFFDQTHEAGDSGSQYNLLTSSEVTQLDIASATAPTQAEAAAAMLAVIGYMMNYKDSGGKAVNSMARNWLAMVPYNLFASFQSAVRGTGLTGASGAVSTGPLAGSDFNIEVAMNPALASSASAVWYMFRTDGGRKPFIRQEEVGLKTEYLAEGSEQEILNRRHIYGVSAVRAAGYGHWHHAAKCTLS